MSTNTETSAHSPEELRLELDGRTVGGGAPPLIIAEAGSAHAGDAEKARRLIDYAAEAGADCIKFQAIIADEIVHPAAGSIRLPGGPVAIHERFRRLEQPAEFYARLKEESERAGLLFLCSPFGRESATMLLTLGVAGIKIASPELNHYPLLQEAAAVPLLLSTGVSSLADIEESCDFLEERDGQFALLHCITAYPAPAREYNLRLIPLLRRLFGRPVGVSDHSTEPLLVPLLAAAEGAAVIEKHITFPERGSGLDDPIALPPAQFAAMCGALRELRGSPAEAFRARLARDYPEEVIEGVRGSGRKRLAPSERPFYPRSKRSVVALRDLEEGERVDEESCALLRSEQNRPAGLRPAQWPMVRGSRITRSLSAGEGLTWSHLLRSD
jgi:N-acetylneuraminate synthase